jgi:hypothetical protein
MDNEQEQEKQELQWGEARAQMRITLEIFFTEKGFQLHVKSGEDDILSDNKAAYLLRRMICEELSEKANGIVKGVCESARIFAAIANESKTPKVAEAAADLGDLIGLKDDHNED